MPGYCTEAYAYLKLTNFTQQSSFTQWCIDLATFDQKMTAGILTDDYEYSPLRMWNLSKSGK